jgi:hypothetical protein
MALLLSLMEQSGVWVQAVGLLFTPESPIWLHWKGRRAAALYCEHRLLGSMWRQEGEIEADAPDAEAPLRDDNEEQVVLWPFPLLHGQQER